MKRIVLAVALATLVLGGLSACGANTNSVSYKYGYELGQNDGPGLTGGAGDGVDPTTCQAVVNMGLAWTPDMSSQFPSKSDFIAGFMAGCHAAGGK